VAPGFEAYSYVMWWVRRDPDAVCDRLTEAANAALRQPDVQRGRRPSGFLLRGTDRRAPARIVLAEAARWGRIIRERNIQFDG
jgi:hypothetical protein